MQLTASCGPFRAFVRQLLEKAAEIFDSLFLDGSEIYAKIYNKIVFVNL